MKSSEFVDKWSKVGLKEISAAQSHFNDLCSLVGHPTPTEADPEGKYFTFEEPAKKPGGKPGRADVWYKGHFIMEYKGHHKNLEKAYEQLLLYREHLGNPPLLITSDMHKIIIHTNFTNTIKEIYEITLDDINKGDGVEILKKAFNEPLTFKPEVTQKQVTEATADSFLEITKLLESWASYNKERYRPERIAHFITKLFFSLFAEDMGLLPDSLLTDLSGDDEITMEQFTSRIRNLFTSMKKGGNFGVHTIRNFDGNLFDDDYVPPLRSGDIKDKINKAAKQDWSSIDPSIFGTLFERVIDKEKRSQLGLHYTSKEDILLVVEPVVMKLLREEWYEVKKQVNRLIKDDKKGEAFESLKKFSKKLSDIKILDPACGSGNFLYVALQQLLDLQKEVIVFAERKKIGKISLSVTPHQLYGIEKDLYAYELSQVTVWIGYIQWRFENGFGKIKDPILKPLDNIQHKDAILEYTKDNVPKEPTWPKVDFIVGNPPFLGSRKMKPDLGEKYCTDLRSLYKNRLEGFPDLVCYWFEKARKALVDGNVERVGLLATQAIRGGTNREVLDRITEQGNIFMAWSDKEWILEGATVHVSIIAFDRGEEKDIVLNGETVKHINADLTSTIDLTQANNLKENENISFQGVVLRGKFTLTEKEAKKFLEEKNPSGLKNSNVIKLRKTGRDILHKKGGSYIIDFDSMELETARKYQLPFKYIKKNVYPERQKASQKLAREKWWVHWRSRPEMKEALEELSRYIATPTVAKHRVFVWLKPNVVPDVQLIVFARSDDYFFGVLHSRVHELWARRKGTQLRDAESAFRYTPTTTFETFPFPWPPNREPKNNNKKKQISNAAKELVEFRNNWMHPSKDKVGILISEDTVAKRTLTNLYNALAIYREEFKGRERSGKKWNKKIGKHIIGLDEIQELDYIHNNLDKAVIKAYEIPTTYSDSQILSHLYNLNLERSGAKS